MEHAPSEPARAGGDVSQPRGDSAATTQALCGAERDLGAKPNACAKACEQPPSVSAAAAQESAKQQPVKHAPSEPACAGGNASQPRFDVVASTQAMRGAGRSVATVSGSGTDSSLQQAATAAAATRQLSSGESEANPIILAAVNKDWERTTKLADAISTVVVIHDTRLALVFRSTDGALALPINRNAMPFSGLHAAQLAIQIVIGPIWDVEAEYSRDRLNLRLVGLLRGSKAKGSPPLCALYALKLPSLAPQGQGLTLLARALKLRSPTDTTASKFAEMVVGVPAELALDEWQKSVAKQTIATVCRKDFVNGFGFSGTIAAAVGETAGPSPNNATAICTRADVAVQMKVDRWWTPGNASFSQEPEEEFGEEVETRGHVPERALGIIAPFSTGHPREGAELGDGSEGEERPTMDATRKVFESAAGDKGVSSAEEDAPMDAQFAEPDTWRPFTEDPIAFLNKIMPSAALPTAQVIGADQNSDAYCQEIIPVLQLGPSGTKASRQELDLALVSGRARESRLRSIRKQEGYLDSYSYSYS